MKTLNIKKKLLSLALVAVAVMGIGTSVAYSQIDYNDPNNQPIKNAIFNAYTNVPNGVGNEADFVRLRTSNGDPTVPATNNVFTDPVNAKCVVGSKFDVRTYIHNSANAEFNNNGTGTAVAKNVNVAMTAPLGTAGKKFTFKSVISASNAASVTDTGVLNCEDNVQLKLVPQTVKVYTKNLGWKTAADSAVNGNLPIGSRAFGSGTQWGCWEDRIVVVYAVEVVKVPVVENPVYTCDALEVVKLGGDRKYQYTVKYTAKNGATLKLAAFNFGDSSEEVTVTKSPFTATHEYKKDGTYTTQATLTFTVLGAEKVVKDAKCSTTIKTTTPVEYCEVPGKENLPKDSPDCVEATPVTKVTTIPSTGVAGIASGLVGGTALSYSLYAWAESKRALKNLLRLK